MGLSVCKDCVPVKVAWGHSEAKLPRILAHLPSSMLIQQKPDDNSLRDILSPSCRTVAVTMAKYATQNGRIGI